MDNLLILGSMSLIGLLDIIVAGLGSPGIKCMNGSDMEFL